ncbi:MAG: tetratricopeptide repeat protein [Methylomonas sp.]|jgi:tetratricopeptide (TPR) repeat protein
MNDKQDWEEISRNATALDHQGQYAEAVALYELLVEQFPQRHELQANYGTLLLRMGDYEACVRAYDQSLAINNAQAEIYSNRGVALYYLKRHEAAVTSLERAISLKPDYAQAYSNRGLALQELALFDAAIGSFQQALLLTPAYPEAYSNQGNCLQSLGRYTEAVTCYDKAIALNPNFAQAHCNRGNALKELKAFDAAISSYDQAIALAPDYAEAYYGRAMALYGLKQYEKAIVFFDKAIALKPDYAVACFNCGMAYKELDRFDKVLAYFDRAIAANPDYAEAWSNRGLALQELKLLDAAIGSFQKALELNPDYSEAYSNQGNCLQLLGRYTEAISYYKKAIALNPDFAPAYCNLGNALRELKSFDAALADYDRAIAMKPGFIDAYWNKALLLLLMGDYWQGWRFYEWRFKLEKPKIELREYAKPRFIDQAINNKTVFLYAEQGLGDTLQFCRYAKLLAGQGAAVILEVPSPLVSLIATLDTGVKIIPPDTGISEFDYHGPLLSLPYVLNAKVYSIPMEKAYLTADATKSLNWAQRLGEKSEKKRLRIGLAWSGSTLHTNNKFRSIPLTLFEKLLELPFEFHSLQKEVQPDDTDYFRKLDNLTSHHALLHDFSETAALIWQMDLIIAVDTSVAHLAGALGKPVWILLPHIPDFRWLLERTDTPWYASARLYRQDASRDWRTVIAKVIEDLANL